jgi:hypothetical protein
LYIHEKKFGKDVRRMKDKEREGPDEKKPGEKN